MPHRYSSVRLAATSWPDCDTGQTMSTSLPDRFHYDDDYDKEAHDRREMLRRLAMTPTDRVHDNAAAYRIWVIGQRNRARKLAEAHGSGPSDGSA